MADFSAFLDSLQGSLQALGDSSSVHVTAGNESCDLDSMISALTHAHYLASKGGVTSLPLFQCPREELPLRMEAVWLFKELSIDTSKLVFADDLTEERLSKAAHLSLTLVDHHFPTGPLSQFSSAVVEAIDHHQQQEGEVTWKSVIEPVGSCSTLIADKLLNDDSYHVEGTVASLLLAAILLDTANLKEGEGRASEKDKTTVERLLPLASLSREQLFQELFKARFDVSGLSISQLLRKDFKCITTAHFTIGFSSITCLPTDILQRDNFLSDLEKFSTTHNLHTLVLLGITVSLDGSKQRQIALYQPPSATDISSDFAESLASVLEASSDLQCERVAGQQFDGPLLEQHNTAMSRKHILPIVTHFLATVDSEDPSPKPKEEPQAHTVAQAAVLNVSSTERTAPLEPRVTVVTTPLGEGPEKSQAPAIPEYSFEDETHDSRTYRCIQVGGEEMTINLTLIEPYKKVIQHGGYIGEERRALVVISACYLPPRSLPNHNILIHQLFFYVLSVLDQLVVDDYVVVYLHSGAPRNSMPSFAIFHKLYQMVNRRLRKQLQHLYIVHPTFWVKTVLRLVRPFISGKFYRKVHFIRTLHDLSAHVTLADEYIPAPVLRVDAALNPPSQRYKAAEQPTEQPTQQPTKQPAEQ